MECDTQTFEGGDLRDGFGSVEVWSSCECAHNTKIASTTNKEDVDSHIESCQAPLKELSRHSIGHRLLQKDESLHQNCPSQSGLDMR